MLSRRTLLEAGVERAAEVQAGGRRVLRGKVSALKIHGASVYDLGGIEGMLHVSELSFQRARHPKDVLSAGQDMPVQVIARSRRGQKSVRISLSLKSLAMIRGARSRADFRWAVSTAAR